MNGALRVSVLAALWVMTAPDGLRGQRLGEPTPRQHERAGRYEEAARGYQITLDLEPANLSGLLGLERTVQAQCFFGIGRATGLETAIDAEER